MRVTLYMAISADGFIAKQDGDSDWVSEVDFSNFQQKIKEAGCIIVGNRTFEQYREDLYPINDVTNIVLTSNSSLVSHDNVVYSNSPQQALDKASEREYNQVLLIGGGITNGLFLKENLIDEIFLSVHPLVLGEGIKLFENTKNDLTLELLDNKELGEGLVLLYYRVTK